MASVLSKGGSWFLHQNAQFPALLRGTATMEGSLMIFPQKLPGPRLDEALGISALAEVPTDFGQPINPAPTPVGATLYPLLALVELDVAPTGPAATQIATGEIAVGQLDLEYVIPARLALVTCPDSRSARLSINRDVVVNDPAIRVI